MVKHKEDTIIEGEEKSKAIVTMSIKHYLNMINNHLNEKTNTIKKLILKRKRKIEKK